ncbi:MAG: hypothetical protein ACAH88_16225 [Roseimicrobium sp.]
MSKTHGAFANPKLPEQIKVSSDNAPKAVQEHSAQRHTYHQEEPEDFPSRRLRLRQNAGDTRKQKTQPNDHDSHVCHHVGILNLQKYKVLYELNHVS